MVALSLTQPKGMIYLCIIQYIFHLGAGSGDWKVCSLAESNHTIWADICT